MACGGGQRKGDMQLVDRWAWRRAYEPPLDKMHDLTHPMHSTHIGLLPIRQSTALRRRRPCKRLPAAGTPATGSAANSCHSGCLSGAVSRRQRSSDSSFRPPCGSASQGRPALRIPVNSHPWANGGTPWRCHFSRASALRWNASTPSAPRLDAEKDGEPCAPPSEAASRRCVPTTHPALLRFTFPKPPPPPRALPLPQAPHTARPSSIVGHAG